MDIRKGDLVYILKGELRKYEDVVGDDKAKEKTESGSSNKRVGKVLHVDRKKNTVLVEGFNIVKRHARPTQKNPQGGIVTKEAPIHRSRVALWSSELNAPTKIGTEVITAPDGTKTRVRVCKKTGTQI